jgi:hypothetical protein
MIASRKRSPNWIVTREASFAAATADKHHIHATNRPTTGFRYIGPAMNQTQAKMLLGR